MNARESISAVRLLLAAFPKQSFSEDTVMLWARSIQKFEMRDVGEATLVMAEREDWVPSLAEWVEAIRDERDHRVREERKALPAPVKVGSYYPLAQFLRDHPEMGERVKELQESAYRQPGAGENPIVAALAFMLREELVPDRKDDPR